jgi:hypothetical protein
MKLQMRVKQSVPEERNAEMKDRVTTTADRPHRTCAAADQRWVKWSLRAAMHQEKKSTMA